MKSDKKSNVQLYPNKQRVIPNCKLAKVINNLSNENYSDMVVIAVLVNNETKIFLIQMVATFNLNFILDNLQFCYR